MDAVASAAGRLILTSANGAGTPREFILDGRNVTIGRAPACTISLPDDQLASRLHAMLHFTGEHYTISDLGSSNGTLVNGALIQGAMPLADGDCISVGEYIITFAQQTAAQPAAAAEVQTHASAADVAPTAPETPTVAEDFVPATAPGSTEPPQGWSSFVSHSPAPQGWPPVAPESASVSSRDAVDEPATTPLPAMPAPGANPWATPEPPQWSTGQVAAVQQAEAQQDDDAPNVQSFAAPVEPTDESAPPRSDGSR
jgi:pSer/pThr/pTyr-binding forkhead associated (FHA) protein